MANEPRIKKILTQAHAQKLLSPSSEENPCLLGTINTANSLLFLLQQAEGQGLDNEQIGKCSGLHINTIKMYMRALLFLGYVSRSEVENNKGEGAHKAVWAIKQE